MGLQERSCACACMCEPECNSVCTCVYLCVRMPVGLTCGRGMFPTKEERVGEGGDGRSADRRGKKETGERQLGREKGGDRDPHTHTYSTPLPRDRSGEWEP